MDEYEQKKSRILASFVIDIYKLNFHGSHASYAVNLAQICTEIQTGIIVFNFIYQPILQHPEIKLRNAYNVSLYPTPKQSGEYWGRQHNAPELRKQFFKQQNMSHSSVQHMNACRVQLKCKLLSVIIDELILDVKNKFFVEISVPNGESSGTAQ